MVVPFQILLLICHGTKTEAAGAMARQLGPFVGCG
jgi:hypothetical protein